MKIQQVVKKLSVGYRQTDRQTGDLISLLSFLESRLKIVKVLLRLWVHQQSRAESTCVKSESTAEVPKHLYPAPPLKTLTGIRAPLHPHKFK
jgi:hypothetical protein